MKVLVACEYSGTVRDAFIRRGHDAVSCDIIDTESQGPHIKGDAIEAAYSGSWDMMVAHPPCTYLSYAGMRHWNNPGREAERQRAMIFFKTLMDAPIEKICVENPMGEPCKHFKNYQTVNPFDFGEPVRKRTLLWLKNLPPLMFSAQASVRPVYVDAGGKARHYTEAMRGCSGGKEGRRKARAKFFISIAEAMATQWG